MIVTFARIIKYGLQSFLRNGLLSVSTVSVMILALLVFEGLILFNVLSKGAIQSIQNKVDVSVYFKSNVPEDSILHIKRTLEGLEEVRSIEYISSDQALQNFKLKHAKEDMLIQTLDELGENPLLPSLNVKAKDLSQYGTIASYLESTALKDLVHKVTYAQNQVVFERLTKVVDTFEKGGFALTVFLALLAVMVTFNTIRLAIFSNSEQISIMRLVGAPNSFIRGPYIVEGVVYGVLAALVSFSIMVPIVSFTSPYISNFVSDVDMALYFRNNFFQLLGYQVLFGILLSIISSSIAIRKYLKV